MNEHIISAVQHLPRGQLEQLALRAMAELAQDRKLSGADAYFGAMLVGLLTGAAISLAGIYLESLFK
jgi:hypothetical protein